MVIKTYSQIKSIVEDNNESDIDNSVIVCLIWKESGFNPDIKSNQSNSSATGLMQITKTAVKEVNRVRKTSYNHDDMTNPELNVEVGTTYLDVFMKRFGQKLERALDAYGTGSPYHKSIIDCSDCIKALKDGTSNPTECLLKIHK